MGSSSQKSVSARDLGRIWKNAINDQLDNSSPNIAQNIFFFHMANELGITFIVWKKNKIVERHKAKIKKVDQILSQG